MNILNTGQLSGLSMVISTAAQLYTTESRMNLIEMRRSCRLALYIDVFVSRVIRLHILSSVL